MKPAPFDYLACDSEAEALACLAEHGDHANVVAGGQSLLAMLNMRLLQPHVLVDINRVESLAQMSEAAEGLHVRAAVTQSRLYNYQGLQTLVPLLAKALPHVGHFQTRNKGTVCGSLAHADPSSEIPLVASVLDTAIELQTVRGKRVIPARDFFTGLLQTMRQPDELLTRVTFPVAKPGEGYGFQEVAMRHGDFAVLAVAVKMTEQSITIGIGGSAEKPEVREFPKLEGSALDDALNALAWELPMQDDTQAPASYRRRLVRLLGRKTIEEARQCLS